MMVVQPTLVGYVISEDCTSIGREIMFDRDTFT